MNALEAEVPPLVALRSVHQLPNAWMTGELSLTAGMSKWSSEPEKAMRNEGDHDRSKPDVAVVHCSLFWETVESAPEKTQGPKQYQRANY